MGSCLSRQTNPTGKADKDKETAETYSNETRYFIQQIVALIAHETYSVPTDVAETLMLTYPFYSNSIDLLNAIKDRFFITYSRYEYINCPEYTSMASTYTKKKADSKLEYQDWITTVKIPIQQKCLHLLLRWMSDYWTEDFDRNEEDHGELMQLLTAFIEEIKSDRDKYDNYDSNSNHKTYAAFLQQYILKINGVINSREEWYLNIVRELQNKHKQHQELWDKQIKKSKNFTRNRMLSVENRSRTPSTSAVEKDVAQFSDDLFTELVNYDNMIEYDSDNNSEHKDENVNMLSFLALKNTDTAREYAKQLTIVDWEYFCNISCRECLHKILSKKDTRKHQSIKLFIDRFQQINQYVIVSIIGSPDLKTRVKMMEFFIYVAETLLKLNNLHSFMAVCSALNSLSVQKLKISSEFLNKSTRRKLNEFLSPLCSGKMNYSKLRDYCEIMKPPGIPFLGLILKDLTFANDGNQNKLNKTLDHQINFKKYALLNKICKQNIEYFTGTADEKTQDLANEEQKVENVVYMDLVPDEKLQNEILKDLNSYILLNKNVVRAMAKEANRIDTLQKEEYIQQQKDEDNKLKASHPVKHDSKYFAKHIFQKLFSSSDDTIQKLKKKLSFEDTSNNTE